MHAAAVGQDSPQNVRERMFCSVSLAMRACSRSLVFRPRRPHLPTSGCVSDRFGSPSGRLLSAKLTQRVGGRPADFWMWISRSGMQHVNDAAEIEVAEPQDDGVAYLPGFI